MHFHVGRRFPCRDVSMYIVPVASCLRLTANSTVYCGMKLIILPFAKNQGNLVHFGSFMLLI